VTAAAAAALERGEQVLGYAFYTLQARRRIQAGKDFALHFGRARRADGGFAGLAPAEVGKSVCECLAAEGVQYRWGGDPARPVRVLTASVATLV
jgi:hypothetical protein